MRYILVLACLLLLAPFSVAADKTPEEVERDIKRLRDWLRGPSADRWLRAAKEAKELAPASKELLPELCLLTLNGSKPTRQAAFEAIEMIDKPLYDVLMNNWRNGSDNKGRAPGPAYHRLPDLGENARPAVEMLLRMGELAIATDIAPDHPMVIDSALRMASLRSTRRKGLSILVRTHFEERRKSQAIDLMIAGIKEGHVQTVAPRLAELGVAAAKAIPALKDAKGGKLERDRAAAAEALDAIEQAIADANNAK